MSIEIVDVSVEFWEAVEAINELDPDELEETHAYARLKKLNMSVPPVQFGVSEDSALQSFIVDILPPDVSYDKLKRMYVFSSIDNLFFGMYELFNEFALYDDYRLDELATCIAKIQDRYAVCDAIDDMSRTSVSSQA